MEDLTFVMCTSKQESKQARTCLRTRITKNHLRLFFNHGRLHRTQIFHVWRSDLNTFLSQFSQLHRIHMLHLKDDSFPFHVEWMISESFSPRNFYQFCRHRKFCGFPITQKLRSSTSVFGSPADLHSVIHSPICISTFCI